MVLETLGSVHTDLLGIKLGGHRHLPKTEYPTHFLASLKDPCERNLTVSENLNDRTKREQRIQHS